MLKRHIHGAMHVRFRMQLNQGVMRCDATREGLPRWVRLGQLTQAPGSTAAVCEKCSKGVNLILQRTVQ